MAGPTQKGHTHGTFFVLRGDSNQSILLTQEAMADATKNGHFMVRYVFCTTWGSNPDVCICTSREGTVFDMGLMGIESGIRNDKCFGLLSFVNTFHFLQKSNVEGKFFLIQLLFIPQMYSL